MIIIEKKLIYTNKNKWQKVNKTILLRNAQETQIISKAITFYLN